MSAFSNLLILYDKYYVLNNKENTNEFKNDLECEGRKRIEQLDYLLNKIQVKQTRAIEIPQRSQNEFQKLIDNAKQNNLDVTIASSSSIINMTKEEGEEYNHLNFEIELLTENFYRIAFRLSKIIEKLPGLGKLKSNGVRDVRNNLIEHPEAKDIQVILQSFSLGNKESGPIIKAIRYSDQTEIFPDKGLYFNAEEIKTNLEKVLIKFIGSNS